MIVKDDLIFLSASFKGFKKNQDLIEKEILELKKKKDNTQPTKLKQVVVLLKIQLDQTDKKVWELIKESVH